MDIEQLLGSVIEGALTGRRKRGRGALRFLRGGSRSAAAPFLNASTLLTLAGLAWGVFETFNNQQQTGAASPSSGAGVPPPPPPTAGSSQAAAPVVLPPPLPPVVSPAATVPLVPAVTSPAASSVASGVERIIRLTVAAARADGTLTDIERSSIVAHATRAGAVDVVERELQSPTSLATLVAGVEPGAQRDDFYTLAFSIVRADEAVSDAERAWLQELASALALPSDRVAQLESSAATRITDAAN